MKCLGIASWRRRSVRWRDGEAVKVTRDQPGKAFHCLAAERQCWAHRSRFGTQGRVMKAAGMGKNLEVFAGVKDYRMTDEMTTAAGTCVG